MRCRHFGVRVFALVGFATVAIGCSRSTPPGAAQGSTATSAAAATSSGAGPCALVSQADVAAAVGNAVTKGEPQGGGTCKWDTPNTEDVSVLLIVHRKGDTSEPYLCQDVRKNAGTDRVEGLDAATWKFTKMGPFNSGDIEGCGPKGYLTLQLSGKRDEAQLKKAALTIAGAVVRRQ